MDRQGCGPRTRCSWEGPPARPRRLIVPQLSAATGDLYGLNLNGAATGAPDGGGATTRATQTSAIARQAARDSTTSSAASAKPTSLAQIVSDLSPFGVERGR